MSNIKRVEIVANVPFCWLQDVRFGGMPDSEVAAIASVCLSPSTGLTLTYSNERWTVDNDRGGRTAMYRVMIEGEEALAWVFLERIVAAIHGVKGANIITARAKDVQWPHERNPWESIKPRKPTGPRRITPKKGS